MPCPYLLPIYEMRDHCAILEVLQQRSAYALHAVDRITTWCHCCKLCAKMPRSKATDCRVSKPRAQSHCNAPQRGEPDERGMRQWFLGRKDCMRRLILKAGAEGAAHVTNPTTVLVLQSQQAS